MTRASSRRSPVRDCAAPLAVLLLAAPVACGGGAGAAPRDACLGVTASPNLNLYDGQAHAVTLYLYPLVSTLGFEQANVRDLLDGANPPGLAGPAVLLTIGPGEQREVREAFPGSASHMGIVVDYYRGPGDPQGAGRTVVPATCGMFSSPAITLAPQGILVED